MALNIMHMTVIVCVLTMSVSLITSGAHSGKNKRSNSIECYKNTLIEEISNYMENDSQNFESDELSRIVLQENSPKLLDLHKCNELTILFKNMIQRKQPSLLETLLAYQDWKFSSIMLKHAMLDKDFELARYILSFKTCFNSNLPKILIFADSTIVSEPLTVELLNSLSSIIIEFAFSNDTHKPKKIKKNSSQDTNANILVRRLMESYIPLVANNENNFVSRLMETYIPLEANQLVELIPMLPVWGILSTFLAFAINKDDFDFALELVNLKFDVHASITRFALQSVLRKKNNEQAMTICSMLLLNHSYETSSFGLTSTGDSIEMSDTKTILPSSLCWNIIEWIFNHETPWSKPLDNSHTESIYLFCQQCELFNAKFYEPEKIVKMTKQLMTLSHINVEPTLSVTVFKIWKKVTTK